MVSILQRYNTIYNITDDTINVAYKYIFLSAASKFKGLNDRKKYEKARKLKDCINRIRDDYT